MTQRDDHAAQAFIAAQRMGTTLDRGRTIAAAAGT
jgi:hypothetical protein